MNTSLGIDAALRRSSGEREQLKRLADENTLTATLGTRPRRVVQGKQIATTLTPFLYLLVDSHFIYLSSGSKHRFIY